MYLDVTNDYQFESQLAFPPTLQKIARQSIKNMSLNPSAAMLLIGSERFLVLCISQKMKILASVGLYISK